LANPAGVCSWSALVLLEFLFRDQKQSVVVQLLVQQWVDFQQKESMRL
jgi:hypothetical protein